MYRELVCSISGGTIEFSREFEDDVSWDSLKQVLYDVMKSTTDVRVVREDLMRYAHMMVLSFSCLFT